MTDNLNPSIRVVMMPHMTNPQGTIFGGIILSYIDQAGATEAVRKTGHRRFVTVAMKISQDLERIGDEASKIAKRARDLSLEPPIKLNLDLPKIATLALEMLKAALDAFVNKDSAAARAVIPRDKEVDAMNKQIHAVLVQHMVENPTAIGRCLHWIVASKSLERIADHATNVAEDVVYLYEAQDIRHTGVKSGIAV